MSYCHAYAKEIEVRGQLVQKIEWEQTDTTDRIIVRANAVGNYLLGAAAKTTV